MTREGDTYRVIARQAKALESIATSLETIAATSVQQAVAGMGDLIEGDAEKADVGEYMDPPDSQPPPPTDGWLDPVEPDDPEDQGGPEKVDWTGGKGR